MKHLDPSTTPPSPPSATSSPAPFLFGDPAAVRCERVAAELRSGRPVVIKQQDHRLAFIALDTSTPQSYAAFAQAAGQRQYLFIPPPRAQAIGLNAPSGARFALADLDYAALISLGYLDGIDAPGNWQAGGLLDAAAVQLARLGLLLPALVSVILPTDDRSFDSSLQILLGDLQDGMVNAAREYTLVTRSPVPLRDIGMTQFAVFRGGVAQRDQVAIIVGHPDANAVVPVRVHSSCLTGDLFGSLKCDCGDQLRHGLLKLKEHGSGVLLYLDQEGRGTGIAAKMRAYGYQHEGLDTIDADAQLGFGPDERRYEAAAAMLRLLGIGRVKLLSNNPSKVDRLRAAGVDVVDREPVTGMITAENEQYLRTKASRAGHALDVDALIHSSR